MAAIASLITRVLCAISQNVTLHAKRDKEIVCLLTQTRQAQSASANLDIKENFALNACHIQDAQEMLPQVVA